jgi:hypothetical protein
MNSMPAPSSARRIFSTVSKLASIRFSSRSSLRIVTIATPASRASRSCLQRRSARAALICRTSTSIRAPTSLSGSTDIGSSKRKRSIIGSLRCISRISARNRFEIFFVRPSQRYSRLQNRMCRLSSRRGARVPSVPPRRSTSGNNSPDGGAVIGRSSLSSPCSFCSRRALARSYYNRDRHPEEARHRRLEGCCSTPYLRPSFETQPRGRSSG